MAATLIIVLLSIAGVVGSMAYSAYVRFQSDSYGRELPGLWSTGQRWTMDGAFMEMLFASDSRMSSRLRLLLLGLRMLILAIAVASLAYVAGWHFHLSPV